MKPFNTECELCGMLFEVYRLERETEMFKDKKVTITFYSCPKCDKKHVTAVYDEESDDMREQLRQVQSKEERTAIERNMHWHNAQLKKAYFKGVRNNDKKIKKYF